MSINALLRPAIGYVVFFLLVAVFSSPAQTAQKNRILRSIEMAETTVLPGHLHPQSRAEFDRGAVAPSFRLAQVALFFRTTAAQQSDLENLLEEQQNPALPNYHTWLTPEQFAERFGLSVDDINRAAAWLESRGLRVEEVARSRNSITFSGTAAQILQTFHTEIHHYNVNGEHHYAAVSEPAIPSALAGVVLGIRGLDDFRPRPRGIRVLSSVRPAVLPQFTPGNPSGHFISPDDFATIYNVKSLYNASIDGAGQKIAVMGQTDIQLSDISRFRSLAGLSVSAPQVVLTGTDPGTSSGDLTEADLDLEWTGAVAKNAQIIYVNSTNVFTSLQYAVQHSLAPVISLSYGVCEAQIPPASLQSLRALAQQANAQGETILASSGDMGAADCDPSTAVSATLGPAVDVPASIPEVTGVGGTEFSADVANPNTYWSSTNNSANGSALSYIPETSWNDPPGGSKPFIAASGGGVSTQFTKPSWQTGTGVPADGHRDVPDIAFSSSAAHDGYLVCTAGNCVNGFLDGQGKLMVVGGTSVATPVFAGIVALINQETQSTGQGNMNPSLYLLAASHPSAFHDIATGSNIVPCTSGSTGCPGNGSFGFSAGTGYDQVTGLGSVDAFALASIWPASGGGGPDFSMSAAPNPMTVTSGSTTTATLTVTASNGFTGAVNFSCTIPLPFASSDCTVSPTSLNTSGTATIHIGTTHGFLIGPRTRRFIYPRPSIPALGVLSLTLLFVLALTAKSMRSVGLRGSRATVPVCVGLLLVAGFGVAGCSHLGSTGGGGGGGTNVAAGTVGTATVTATSGSITHSTLVSITVQ